MKCPFFLDKLNLSNKKIKTNNLILYTYLNDPKHPLHDDHVINEIVYPIKSSPYRVWYEKNEETRNHAKHCVPLAMANSLGYILRSPATFRVIWDGKEDEQAQVEIIKNKNKTHSVTTHSRPGSFTLQYRFVPKTNSKHYTYIKGVSNIRTKFNVMEAIIESWWFEGFFGVVCLLNQPCDFIINEGDPIATIMLLNKDSLKFNISMQKLDNKTCPAFRYWDWWQHIKNNFYKICQNNAKKLELLKFFKSLNKTLILDKNRSWPFKPYHDFDYANGRHLIEKIKPKNRPHFMPKDLIDKENNKGCLHVDDYNRSIDK